MRYRESVTFRGESRTSLSPRRYPHPGLDQVRTLGRRPVESEVRPPKAAGLRVGINGVLPSPRVLLGWGTASGDDLHEVRILGGADTWDRLKSNGVLVQAWW